MQLTFTGHDVHTEILPIKLILHLVSVAILATLSISFLFHFLVSTILFIFFFFSFSFFFFFGFISLFVCETHDFDHPSAVYSGYNWFSILCALGRRNCALSLSAPLRRISPTTSESACIRPDHHLPSTKTSTHPCFLS